MTKYWTRSQGAWFYELKDSDPDYVDKTKVKSEKVHCHTNIAAKIQPDEDSDSFNVGLGGVGGAFQFAHLQDAKKFVETFYKHRITG